MKFNKTQRGWSMYDWANSVYSLVISTVLFPIYYEAVSSNEISSTIWLFGIEWENTVIYNYVIGFSYLLIAVLSPYFAAMGDRTGRRKVFMRSFLVMGSVATMGMYFFTASNPGYGLATAFVASIGFSGSIVFYNAFLPVIAPKEMHDQLSARGFAFGYLGSSLLLLLALVLVQKPDWFGFADPGQATRFSFALTGVWWLGFGLRSISTLPKDEVKDYFEGKLFRTSWNELFLVLKEFRALGDIRRFLSAFFWYSAGMQTVVLVAGVFGAKVLGLESTALIIVVLIIQFIAIAGSYSFAWLSGKTSNEFSIAVGVSAWLVVVILAYFVQNEYQFYSLGVGLGFVLGAVQSISRSTYSKMLPKTEDPTTYFSFYDVMEKLAITFGMFSVGVIEAYTGDFRNGVLAIGLFFAVGLVQILRLRRFQKKTAV